MRVVQGHNKRREGKMHFLFFGEGMQEGLEEDTFWVG